MYYVIQEYSENPLAVTGYLDNYSAVHAHTFSGKTYGAELSHDHQFVGFKLCKWISIK
jgi:hypothetical protein